MGILQAMHRKGGADEALHKSNNAINSRKLNRTKLSTIACDVKRGVIFVWHCVHDVKHGVISVWHCVHDFCFLLVMRRERQLFIIDNAC
jgi:hypothetical protein